MFLINQSLLIAHKVLKLVLQVKLQRTVNVSAFNAAVYRKNRVIFLNIKLCRTLQNVEIGCN